MEREKSNEAALDPLAEMEPEADPLIVNAIQLFDGRREIWLELAGVRYRLRITRRNKLILQK